MLLLMLSEAAHAASAQPPALNAAPWSAPLLLLLLSLLLQLLARPGVKEAAAAAAPAGTVVSCTALLWLKRLGVPLPSLLPCLRGLSPVLCLGFQSV